MAAADEEDSLRNKLQALDSGDPAYAATLNDLALLKLNQAREWAAGSEGRAAGSEDGGSWVDSGHDCRSYAEQNSGADDGALRESLGDCSHVLEVYGLTTATRSSHLEEFVEIFCSQEGRPLPLIKWIDDHHALIVCPDRAIARCLLQEDQGVFQLRPFAEASAGARAVAAAELLPPRERPKTTAAVAKRFLSHALGRSDLRDRAAEKDLAQQRKAAREARKEREQKIASAWDDD
ncbi:hypothetical protein GPECTOR_33g627 [Gonium pectorale]|uniref:R3H domain-containing protein n=1 Tax=Gonium pectorale TaxID=33097 RepID=A0A150GDS4_GONPE|nr:hypothetical protein GPECTOR_33g627 [Gonium pectorale]|eukprot:KXZ47745.1 hypothetical protein GPECTOR_33g627 [Gonium pectorale]